MLKFNISDSINRACFIHS